MRALAVVLALLAVVLMIVAIAGMVTNRQSARTGWLVRLLALGLFAAAVALNAASR